jgi:hypothetical protein
MTHPDQLAEVRQKILELEREQQRISEQIAAYQQLRDALIKISKTTSAPALVPLKIGKAEAIRVILGKHPAGLTPREIRDELIGYGISIGSDKNFLGNIHTIIKRDLNIREEGVGGRKVYKLVTDAKEGDDE